MKNFNKSLGLLVLLVLIYNQFTETFEVMRGEINQYFESLYKMDLHKLKPSCRKAEPFGSCDILIISVKTVETAPLKFPFTLLNDPHLNKASFTTCFWAQ